MIPDLWAGNKQGLTTGCPHNKIEGMNTAPSRMYRLWDAGQQFLAAGRYVAARTLLESAAALARHDAASLARIHLPLLEATRQIRQLAVEGLIVIVPRSTDSHRFTLNTFLAAEAGTILLDASDRPAALHTAQKIAHTARRTGRCLETLLLAPHRGQFRLAAPADPATTLPVEFSPRPLGESTDADLIVPLPSPGLFSPDDPAAALARESLLIAWEALALRWQARHPLRHPTPETELRWLRRALEIDPACEPVAMRLIALAESISRH